MHVEIADIKNHVSLDTICPKACRETCEVGLESKFCLTRLRTLHLLLGQDDATLRAPAEEGTEFRLPRSELDRDRASNALAQFIKKFADPATHGEEYKTPPCPSSWHSVHQ